MALSFKELKEFTVQQLARLKKEYEPLKGQRLGMDQINKMNTMLSKYSTDMLMKLANADIPFLATAAKSIAVMKRGKKWSDFKTKLDMSEADELQCEACWTGYKQVGFKKSSRTGKRVPNCVPESVVKEMLGEVNDIRGNLSDAQLQRMKQEWQNKPASALTQGVKQTIMNMDAPTRAALEDAKINHISKFAGSTFEQKEEVDPSCKICEGEACECAQGEDIQENVNAIVSRVKGMVGSVEYDKRDRAIIVPDKDVKKVADFVKRQSGSKEIYAVIGDKENVTRTTSGKASARKIKDRFYDDKIHGKQDQVIINPSLGMREETDLEEGMVKRVMQTVHDKLSKEGGAAGFDDLAKEVKKEFGITISKDTLKNMPGVKQHRDGDYILETDLKEFKKMVVTIKDPIKRNQAMQDIQRFGKATGFRIDKMSDGKSFRIDGKGADLNKFATDLKNFYGAEIKAESLEEADLSKSQVKMVHKKADKMPKQDFIKRYGKDGDSVRYATATNMVKKQLGIEEEEFVPEQNKGDNMNEATYKDKFKAAMKDFGINSLDDLKSDADKKKFFKHVDGMHTAKDEELEEGLTPAQKKLPAGLQKAIAKKQGDKEEGAMKRGDNLDTFKPKPKSEEMKEMGTMNAQYEMMKKEMMKKVEMMKAEKDPEQMEMMKKEMMKEMENMPEMMKQEMMKKMEMAMKEGFSSDAQRKAAFASGYKEKGKDKKEMMKMNAMKMPIRAMYSRAGKTGDDDMSPVNNMKLNAMIKDPHKSKEDKPMKDMNAGYMKSDVRADVKNNGGADMSKVKDAPKMQTAMKKINAMYKTEKYLDEKEGSIQNTVAQMYQTESRLVEVQDKNLEKMISDYLKKGGTISKLPPALAKGMKPSEMKPHKVGDKGVIKSMYKMKEVREFVDTYNRHFLVNYKAEELMAEARYEVSHDYGSRFGSYGVTLTAVVDATSPQDAMKKGHDKLETLSMSAQGKKLGVDELQDPDDEGKPSVKTTSKPITYTDMKKF